MSKIDGGYLYPRKEEDGQGGFVDHPGITVRDYIATQCLAGMLSDSEYFPKNTEEAARNAFDWADALLKESGK